ncbi:MFS transporter [Pseudonocardia sp. WMMC193]|uniref:MFS transporter n=1 Tax=Pseudonocardia sp. WMMC193 TaxID=2911965 RepID=UPI001F2E90FC|nr:MFS transporter [Pseudonocardia sp. WMMC193]MCF7552025.1 MFS transporter [Pseudonocardia sp. WMMC193]
MSLTAPLPVATATPPDLAGRGRPRALVAVLSLAGIMASMQQTMVVPLIPQLPTLLGVSAADASWAVTATLLSAAVATPTVGRLADMYGKRRMMLICLAFVIVGSGVAALTTDLPGLLVGRAFQGMGIGIIPLGISAMRDHLPVRALPRATAKMSASLGVGGAFGLPLGALLVGHASWHAMFVVSAVTAALVIVLVLRFVPESPAPGGRFDLVGAVGLSLSLLALLLALSKGSTWGRPVTLGLFGGAAALLVAWAVWELRVPQPLVDLRVSRRRQVLLTNLTSPLFGFGILTSSLVFPQLLQLSAETGYGFGQSVLVAGLLQAPGGIAMMLMSSVSARITERAGPRTSLMTGALVTAVGYAFAVFWHGELWQVVVAVSVAAAGVGIAYGAMPALIMGAVPLGQTAAANSVNNLTKAVGTSLASATAGMVLAGMTTTVAGHTHPSHAAFVLVLVIAAVASLVAVAVAFFLPRGRAR